MLIEQRNRVRVCQLLQKVKPTETASAARLVMLLTNEKENEDTTNEHARLHHEEYRIGHVWHSLLGHSFVKYASLTLSSASRFSSNRTSRSWVLRVGGAPGVRLRVGVCFRFPTSG